MPVETLLAFALMEFLLCLTPGPAVLIVVGTAMRRGLGAGWAAGAGVTAGTAFYFALSALGVGALIVASVTLFTVLKWVGAAYLCLLGLKMMWPVLRPLLKGERPLRALADAGRSSELSSAPSPALAADDGAAAGRVWRAAFLRGFAGQLANPKTLIFFLALFPQFISPDGSVALQFSLMAAVSAAIEMPILMLYALVSAASVRWMRERFVLLFEAVAGAVLVLIGGTLAATRGR